MKGDGDLWPRHADRIADHWGRCCTAKAVSILAVYGPGVVVAAYVQQNRQVLQQANQQLVSQRYKIRIRNDFVWDVVFGIFGMRDNVLGYPENMNWRHRVKANDTCQSGANGPIAGGERAIVVRDEFAEAIIYNNWITVDRNLTITIDNARNVSLT